MLQELKGKHSMEKSSFVLISNGEGLTQPMHHLKDAGYEVVLIHKRPTNHILNSDSSASRVYHWSELVGDDSIPESIIKDETWIDESGVPISLNEDQNAQKGGIDGNTQYNAPDQSIKFISLAMGDTTAGEKPWTPQSSHSTSPVTKTLLSLSPDNVTNMSNSNFPLIQSIPEWQSNSTDNFQFDKTTTSVSNNTNTHSFSSEEIVADAFHRHVLVASTLFRLLHRSLISRIFKSTEKVALRKWRLRTLISCLRAFKTLLICRAKKHLKLTSLLLLKPSSSIMRNATQTIQLINDGENQTSSNLHHKTQETVPPLIGTDSKRKSNSSKTRHSLL